MALFDIFRLRRALADLQDRVEALEHDVKKVDTEWSVWYDKFRRLLSSLAKREARAREDAPGSTIDARSDSDPDPITTSVLARRRRFQP